MFQEEEQQSSDPGGKTDKIYNVYVSLYMMMIVMITMMMMVMTRHTLTKNDIRVSNYHKPTHLSVVSQDDLLSTFVVKYNPHSMLGAFHNLFNTY